MMLSHYIQALLDTFLSTVIGLEIDDISVLNFAWRTFKDRNTHIHGLIFFEISRWKQQRSKIITLRLSATTERLSSSFTVDRLGLSRFLLLRALLLSAQSKAVKESRKETSGAMSAPDATRRSVRSRGGRRALLRQETSDTLLLTPSPRETTPDDEACFVDAEGKKIGELDKSAACIKALGCLY